MKKAALKKALRPPRAFESFVVRYPELGRAWETIHDAGHKGPLDERTARLIKLGVAFGALREGPVHANVRKALALGIGVAEIEQIVALAAATIGMPATVAIDSWVRDITERKRRRR